MLQNECPDGRHCSEQKCCRTHGRPRVYACCPYGILATCCRDLQTCCPQGWTCIITTRQCGRSTYSSVLRVQAAVLVNSTGKRCRDGTTDMELKAGKSIPTQQIETAMKRSGFIGTSGDVSSPDEKYKCPEGTSTCELSSGNDGCCPIQNAKWIKIKIMNTISHPHSPEGMWSFARDLVFSRLWKTVFCYQSLNQLFFGKKKQLK